MQGSSAPPRVTENCFHLPAGPGALPSGPGPDPCPHPRPPPSRSGGGAPPEPHSALSSARPLLWLGPSAGTDTHEAQSKHPAHQGPVWEVIIKTRQAPSFPPTHRPTDPPREGPGLHTGEGPFPQPLLPGRPARTATGSGAGGETKGWVGPRPGGRLWSPGQDLRGKSRGPMRLTCPETLSPNTCFPRRATGAWLQEPPPPTPSVTTSVTGDCMPVPSNRVATRGRFLNRGKIRIT